MGKAGLALANRAEAVADGMEAPPVGLVVAWLVLVASMVA